jgi:hypothetical protein
MADPSKEIVIDRNFLGCGAARPESESENRLRGMNGNARIAAAESRCFCRSVNGWNLSSQEFDNIQMLCKQVKYECMQLKLLFNFDGAHLKN